MPNKSTMHRVGIIVDVLDLVIALLCVMRQGVTLR
jgi:hypothetical protein